MIRKHVLQGCLATIGIREYCECSSDQLAVFLADADLSTLASPADLRIEPASRREQFDQQLTEACASKIPEQVVKSMYLKGCSKPGHRAFCECTWVELRKHLSPIDFSRGDSTPQAVEAKKTAVGSCKGTISPVAAKREFMKTCSFGDPAEKKRCACIWKKVTDAHAIEEVAANVVPLWNVPGVSDCE